MKLPRFRLTVRLTMLLVLMLACCLGWYLHLARVQRQIVQAIRDAGGTVSYDWQHSNGQTVKDGHPAGPRWLQSHLGPDLFNHVTLVQLGGTRTDQADELMTRIGQLRRLESLSADFTSLGNDGLARVAGLSRLRYLSLSHTKVTDEGLADLRGLARLEHLNLLDTKVSDAGMEHLAGLKDLKSLELFRSRVTDLGLKRLVGLSGLRTLSLQETRVTDDGVNALQSALPGLRIRRQVRSAPIPTD
jgi:hypothetical protein